MYLEFSTTIDFGDGYIAEVDFKGNDQWIAMRSTGRSDFPISEEGMGNVSAAELRFSRAHTRQELAEVIVDHLCGFTPKPLRRKAEGLVLRFLLGAEDLREEVHTL